MASIVVTGASTGIGRACVEEAARAGFHVFASVRKQADADGLSQAFGDKVTPLIFDVTDPAAVRAGADKVREALKGEPLAGLVNNAGVAVAGPLLHLPLEEFRQQIEINLIGVVAVTQAFAPLLTAKAGQGAAGRIVNISSVGGKNANPFMAPYCASKFAVEGLSESLRRELMGLGIDVIVVAPGAVATPIWSKAEEVDVTPYKDTPFAPALDRLRAYMLANGPKGLKPQAIGQAVMKALTAPKPRTRYPVTPDPVQNLMTTILPKRMVDRVIGKQLGLIDG
ncbi:SDR family oxidoreductase [Phenylobacterium sp.]|uniref:SDR family oxidoreductase n=1 Tax=Phenylobacterium sp. TaxID=1871053 RepID=UPI0035B07936